MCCVSSFLRKRQTKLAIALFKIHSHAGEDIIQPIQSARIHTKDSFSLTYGIIESRIKMPKGDWIWPGIFLYRKSLIPRSDLFFNHSFLDGSYFFGVWQQPTIR